MHPKPHPARVEFDQARVCWVRGPRVVQDQISAPLGHHDHVAARVNTHPFAVINVVRVIESELRAGPGDGTGLQCLVNRRHRVVHSIDFLDGVRMTCNQISGLQRLRDASCDKAEGKQGAGHEPFLHGSPLWRNNTGR